MMSKVSIKIPTDLSEISLGQYQRFLKMKEPDHLDILETFTGVSKSVLRKLDTEQVYNLAERVTSLFDQPENPVTLKHKIHGVEFGFINDLDKMAFGAYEDLTYYIQEWDTMHRAMAVLYRPIIHSSKHTYSIEDYETSETYCETMEYMPMDIVMGANVFFYSLLSDLLDYSRTFIQKEVEMRKTLALNRISSETGGPTINFILSLTETLEELKTLPNWTLGQPSPFYHSNKTLINSKLQEQNAQENENSTPSK